MLGGKSINNISEDNNQNSIKNTNKEITNMIDDYYNEKGDSVNSVNKDNINDVIQFNVPQNINIFEPEDGILISFNKKIEEFLFYDKNKKLLGSFNIDQLIKYIVNSHKMSKNFMSNVDISNASHIIEAFIGKSSPNNPTNIIALKDHTTSPFMGNIEMIVSLNNLLHSFEKRRLNGVMMGLDSNDMNKISFIIRQFIIELLNYTLKLLSLITNEIKDNPQHKKLLETISNYSNKVIFRISSFIQKPLQDIILRNNDIEDTFKTLVNLRTNANNKMDNLINTINNQNKYITDLLEKTIQLGGGSSSSKSSSNETSSKSSPNESSSKSSSNETSSKYSSSSSSSSIYSHDFPAKIDRMSSASYIYSDVDSNFFMDNGIDVTSGGSLKDINGEINVDNSNQSNNQLSNLENKSVTNDNLGLSSKISNYIDNII